MKGVTFGNYHTYDEFGLVLTSKEIKSPSPKIKQIEVEGSDGYLDYSDFFGGIKYGNRSLSFSFKLPRISSQDEFLALYSRVQDAIHGQKMQVILDDDPEHYYYGRVTVNEWRSNKNIGEIVIDVDADPWKYNIRVTVVTKDISGTATFLLPNSRKHVVPTITASAAMTYEFGNFKKSVSAGTFIIPELELVEGNNPITITGTGTVTFRYLEGGL